MYDFINYISNKGELLAKIDATKAQIVELEGFGLDVSDTLTRLMILWRWYAMTRGSF